MAHVDLGNLEDARKHLCGLGSGDEEMQRRGQADFDSIRPEDKYSDPFIVAVLIALAQQQRLFIDDQPSTPDPKGKMPAYMPAQPICDSYQSRSFLVSRTFPNSKGRDADLCGPGSCFRHLQRSTRLSFVQGNYSNTAPRQIGRPRPV